MVRILAIDAGTTGVRAIVFDDRGARLGSGYEELAMRYPRPGWAEQDAAEIWRATERVIARALTAAGVAPGEIDAIGVTNQRSSIVGWDARTLAPLSAMISWQDVRAATRANEIQAQGFFVTPNVAVSKADWILHNVREAAAAGREGRLRFGGVEAWLVAKLTNGAHLCDHANASATGFYAHLDARWDAALLAALEMPEGAMPELVASSGRLAVTESGVFGASVPIAGLCGDQQAALYGLGCVVDGDTKCSYGTSAMVDSATGTTLALRGAAVYPLVAWTLDGASEASWCVEGSVITAGAAVQWLRDGLRVADSAEAIGALAATVTDSGGVWMVPALQGLGTPFAQSEVRGLIGGLSRGSGRAQIARALLEGIANRVCDVAEAVWHGVSPPRALRVDGGASRNDLLMQLQSDLLGLPIERSPEPDGSALGVAALARRGVGLAVNDPAAVWHPDRVFEPGSSAAERESTRALWRTRIELAARSG